MPVLHLFQPIFKILVIGLVYNLDQLIKFLKEINQEDYNYIVINGSNISNLNDLEVLLSQYPKVIYNLGKSDLINYNQFKDHSFFKNKSNITVIHFVSRNVIITNGGISKNIKKMQDLENNIQSSFINYNWHQNFSGCFDYVISNNPLAKNNDNLQFYNYSMALGNENKTFAIEVDNIGLKKIFRL